MIIPGHVNEVLTELRKLEVDMLSGSWRSQTAPLANFIKTKTQPSLYWKPKKETERSRDDPSVVADAPMVVSPSLR